MSNVRLFSKKFWIDTIIIVSISVLILYVIAYFLLNAIFDNQQIYQKINKSLEEQGYIFQSNGYIRKSWFPTPNLTFYDISVADKQHLILSADRLNIRFNNSILLGNVEIEKITVNQPQINIRKNKKGEWNIQNLLQIKSNESGSNRFILTDGTVNVFHNKEPYIIENLNIKGKDLNNSGFLHGRGQWQNKSRTIPFQFQTKIRNDQNKLLLQDFSGSLKTQLPFIDETNIQWKLPYIQRKHNENIIEAGGVLIEGKSENGFSFNINDTGWHFNEKEDIIFSPQSNVVFHWTDDDVEWKANIVLEKTSLDGYNFYSNTKYNLTRKTPNLIHTANASAKLNADKDWQHINLSDLVLQTVQSNIDNTHLLWRTNLTGNADYSQKTNVGNIYLSGYLDQQPLTIFSKYSHHEEYSWQSKIVLDTLNLTPHINATTDKIPSLKDVDQFLVAFSQSLKYLGNKKVRADFSIERLKLSNGQIKDFFATITANNKGAEWHDIHADIYGGTLNGNLKLNNANPPTYTINQNLSNINIAELLFDTVGYPYFSGIGNVYVNLSMKGGNNLKTINGDTVFVVENGELRGFNFEDLINNKANFSQNIVHNTLGFNQNTLTPFTYMTMLTQWKDGVGQTPTIIFESDSFTLDGMGSFNIENKNLDYNLELMGKLSEQSTPIHLPLHIMGKLDSPQYAVDYNAVVRDAKNTEERQKAVQNLLKQQWDLFRKSSKN